LPDRHRLEPKSWCSFEIPRNSHYSAHCQLPTVYSSRYYVILRRIDPGTKRFYGPVATSGRSAAFSTEETNRSARPGTDNIRPAIKLNSSRFSRRGRVDIMLPRARGGQPGCNRNFWTVRLLSCLAEPNAGRKNVNHFLTLTNYVYCGREEAAVFSGADSGGDHGDLA